MDSQSLPNSEESPYKGLKRGPDEMSYPSMQAPGPPPGPLPATTPFTSHQLMTITKSHDFLASLLQEPLKSQLQNPVPGTYVRLPIATFTTATPRFSIVVENGLIPIIQRQSFIDLKAFIEGSFQSTIYVHGPQGFGKSFALYHLVCTLCLSSHNRVLYVSDCAVFNKRPYDNIFKALTAAFSRDQEFLATLLPSFKDQSWQEIVDHISHYCDNHKLDGKAASLTFYAIFDQHNGLKVENRITPCDFFNWSGNLDTSVTKRFKIIISASANNDILLTKKSHETHHYLSKLSDVELAAWCNHHNFFPNEDHAALSLAVRSQEIQQRAIRRTPGLPPQLLERETATSA